MADLFARMSPADLRYYPASVHAALMETIHIASLGTLLALVLALPIGVIAAHNLCPFTSLNLLAKLILVSSRSVNSLVWALLFVGIFGSIALFRWDINVRESAVLGLVGAGGIGMTLDSAMNLFQWNRVATILIAIFAVVILAEIVVTVVRKRVL